MLTLRPGCWLFGFGTPMRHMWVLAFGPLRVTFYSSRQWWADKTETE